MSFPILKHLLTSYPSFIYDKKRQKLHKNFKVFRKISVLYILKYLDLVKITTQYWFGIEIVGGEKGLKCKNTESEGLTLLSVLSRLFGRFWAELGEIL